MTTQDRHFSPQVLAADEGNDRYEGMPRRGSGFLDQPYRLSLTPSSTVGPYLAIGLLALEFVFFVQSSWHAQTAARSHRTAAPAPSKGPS